MFPELIDAITHGRSTESIPGVASMVGGQVTVSKKPPLTEDELSALPFPAWDLLDHNIYANTSSLANVGSRPYMPLVTSRGCPFKCAYCHLTMGKAFRTMTAESVLAEIAKLRSGYGIKEFEIIDDCFNLDRKRMYAILTGIRDRFGDVKLHFPNGLRSDVLRPEDMILFKQAGTVSACFAIETSSPRLQKMIHKNLNIDKAILAINAAVEAGIYSTGLFMLGFPTETYEEASGTVDFAARSLLHRALFFIASPYAGTEMADMVSDAHTIGNDDLEQRSYFTNAKNISAMSDRDLQRVVRRAWIGFYLNPKRLLRLVIDHPRVHTLPYFAFRTLLFAFLVLLKDAKRRLSQELKKARFQSHQV